MIIYVDVLIVLNMFVNYFIILASVKFLKKKVKLFRIVLGSLVGAVCSLYIFLPNSSAFFEICFKALMCFSICAVVFGIKPLKQYIKSTGVMFLVTCAYAGVMIAIWKIFKPNGMIINNSVVYLNVSPLSIVIFSVVSYLLFLIGLKIFAKNNAYASECNISITYNNNNTEFKAIVDTGNSVCDIFGDSEVIIVDKSVVEDLFITSDVNRKTRYRAIPYSSVSSVGILDGYRCDSGTVSIGSKSKTLKEPIIAASLTPINDDYSGIVNPQIFD